MIPEGGCQLTEGDGDKEGKGPVDDGGEGGGGGGRARREQLAQHQPGQGTETEAARHSF